MPALDKILPGGGEDIHKHRFFKRFHAMEGIRRDEDRVTLADDSALTSHLKTQASAAYIADLRMRVGMDIADCPCLEADLTHHQIVIPCQHLATDTFFTGDTGCRASLYNHS